MRALAVIAVVVRIGTAAAAPSLPSPSSLETLVGKLQMPPQADLAICVHGPDAVAKALSARLVARSGGRAACPASDGEAARAGWDAVVDVTVSVAGDRVRATGEVRLLASALWGGDSRLAATLFAESVVDDEMRAWLGGPVILKAAVIADGPLRSRTMPLPDLDALAIGLVDTDGDNSAELVVLTPVELVILRIQGPSVVELRRLRLPSTPSLTPSRTETGTLLVRGNEVWAHASGLRDGLHWRAGSTVAEPWRGFGFTGLDKCEAIAGTDVYDCPGAERVWSAMVYTDGDSRTTVMSGPALATVLGPTKTAQELVAGTAITAGRLARGKVVATSGVKLRGEPDTLTVRGLAPGLPVLGRIEHLAGIRGLSIGVVDGTSVLAAVVRDAVTHKTELWLVD